MGKSCHLSSEEDNRNLRMNIFSVLLVIVFNGHWDTVHNDGPLLTCFVSIRGWFGLRVFHNDF